MITTAQTEAQKLRGRLNHPIIDADGQQATEVLATRRG